MSRTGGLPGFHESGWEPSAVISLVLEAALWQRRSTPSYCRDAGLSACRNACGRPLGDRVKGFGPAMSG